MDDWWARTDESIWALLAGVQALLRKCNRLLIQGAHRLDGCFDSLENRTQPSHYFNVTVHVNEPHRKFYTSTRSIFVIETL